MKINLSCKLFDADAQFFINPILECKDIDKMNLYRDKVLIEEGVLWKSKVNGVYDSTNTKFINRLYRMIINKPKPDVFVGIYEIPHGLLALIAAKVNSRPVVVSIIGNPKYSIRNKGLRGIVTNWIYRFSNVITVTGSQSREFLIQNKSLDPKKVFILPNSIPIDDFTEKNVQKKYDLITLGRLSPEKGLLNLLEIVVILRKFLPNIKVGIAGKGPQMKVLLSKINQLQLKKNVFLLGYVESASYFLNSGKIFIATSFTEGLPRTVIQSMVGGVPVIASNVGDMSDLVINDKTGVLIENPHDISSFAESIIDILGNEKKYLKLSKECKIHSTKNYSHRAATKVWNKIFDYLELIKL
jgi:glycosyltransferase involved in cell wall biosynthesis